MKTVKIKVGFGVGLVGSDREDIIDTEMSREEWDDLNSDERDKIIDSYINDFIGNYLDSWAHEVEDES